MVPMIFCPCWSLSPPRVEKTMRNKLRALTGLVLALCLLFCPCLAAFAVESPCIGIGDASANSGDTVSLTLSVSGSPGISGAALSIGYDESAMSLVDVKPLAGGFFSANAEAGHFSWLLGSNKEGDFDLAELVFELSSSAHGDYSVTPTLIGESAGNITNERAEAVEAVFRSGTLSVESASPSDGFVDLLPEAWYREASDYVLSEGIMNGVSDQNFAPNAPASRAMVITTLHRLASTPPAEGENFYIDVPNDQWYSEAIVWASSLGITEGYGNGLYGPGDNITREQLAVFFYRYCGSPTASAKLGSFSDRHEISSWAENALSWAVECGLIQGRGDGILAPKSPCTRAELAQMLLNFSKIQ